MGTKAPARLGDQAQHTWGVNSVSLNTISCPLVADKVGKSIKKMNLAARDSFFTPNNRQRLNERLRFNELDYGLY